MTKVTEILIENVKTGEGKRGPWAKHKVALDNGEEAFIFAPVAPGDEVESEQNGEWTNWKVVGESKGKPAGAPRHSSSAGNITTDQLLAHMHDMKEQLWHGMNDRNRQLDRIENLLEAVAGIVGVDLGAIPKDVPPKREPKTEDNDDPINLDDIPF